MNESTAPLRSSRPRRITGRTLSAFIELLYSTTRVQYATVLEIVIRCTPLIPMYTLHCYTSCYPVCIINIPIQYFDYVVSPFIALVTYSLVLQLHTLNSSISRLFLTSISPVSLGVRIESYYYLTCVLSHLFLICVHQRLVPALVLSLICFPLVHMSQN